MKRFETAARRGSTGVNNPVEITFEIDDDQLTANPPTTGQIALFIAGQRAGGIDTIQNTLQFMADVLDDDDYELLIEKLHDGVELTLITDIVNYLIEEWSARPTGSAPSSSASRKSTGRKSTAKQRSAKAKT